MKDQTSPSVDQNVDHPPSTPCNDVTMQPCNHSPSPNPFIPESNNPSVQPTATPLIHSPTSLHLFTEAAILQQIGTRRLAKFLAGFNGELPPALELRFKVPQQLSQFQPGLCNDATMQPCNDSPSRPNPTIQESPNPSIHPGAAPPIHSSTTPLPQPPAADPDQEAFSCLAQL